MVGLYAVITLAVLVFLLIIAALSRIKRCPSDQILVVYGKVGRGADGESRSSKCIHGGTAFVWPLIQDYAYLSLAPMQINISLRGALSLQNIRVDVPSVFTVGISTDFGVMQNAAERLLGLKHAEIEALAEEIILGQLRSVIATMSIEEINVDREKFVSNINDNVGTELSKIGLKLINVNITDIKDESGFIEALGKEAAARAINEAKIKVAEQERDGEVGRAAAERDQRINVAKANADAVAGENEAKVVKETSDARAINEAKIRVAEQDREGEVGRANAERDQRIQVAKANADAVTGENVARVTEEQSNADRRVQIAEAERRSLVAERTKKADAERESYASEETAEQARADMERAKQLARDVVPAEIEKQKIEIAAEAEAEKRRREAKGDADAIYAKMEAQGRGAFEILDKTAQGLERVVQAAGGDASKAVQLMIANEIKELTAIVGDTVKSIDLSNVVVWDSGGNGSGEGGIKTAEFVKGLWGTFPGMKDVLGLVGLDLPDWALKEMDSEEIKEIVAKAASEIGKKEEKTSDSEDPEA